MKKFLLTLVYGTLIYVPLLFLKEKLDIEDNWWINLALIVFCYFNGSFIYNYFHGIQVMELKHLGSNHGTHRFQVLIKISALNFLKIVGEYVRVEPYSNLVLQHKINKTLNGFPGYNWIKDFASDRNEKVLNISVTDNDLPHPLNFTQITLEKFEESQIQPKQSGLKTRAELEKEFDGLSRYEVAIKTWNQEQELLRKAREEGVEDQLIAYWEAQGRPKMKKKPTKEDFS